MSMVYNLLHWMDHVTEHPGRRHITEVSDDTVDLSRAEGAVLQQGTPRNAKNYNNMETGIFAANVLTSWIWTLLLQNRRQLEDLSGERGEVTLTNSKKYPFSDASHTVDLTDRRSSLDYRVDVEVASVSGGLIECVEVYDRQLNGFKIRFKGSATKATLKYCVTGGKVS